MYLSKLFEEGEGFNMKNLTINEAIKKILNGEEFIVIDHVCSMHLVCSYKHSDKIVTKIWKKYDDKEKVANLYANRFVKPPYDVIHKDLPLNKIGTTPSNKTLNRPLYDEDTGRGFEGSILYLAKRAMVSSIMTVFDIVRPYNGSFVAPKFNDGTDVYYDYIYENDINRACMLNYLSKDPIAIMSDKKTCCNCKHVIIDPHDDLSYTFFCSNAESSQNKLKKPFEDACNEFLAKWGS